MTAEHTDIREGGPRGFEPRRDHQEELKKEIVDENAAVEELLAKMPDLGISNDLETLRNLLGSVNAQTATEAIARALTLEPAEKLRKEREAALRRLDYVRDLHERLSEFATSISAQRESFTELLHETLVLGTQQKVTERMHSVFGRNPVVQHFDELTSNLCDHAGFLLALVEAGDRYQALAGETFDKLKEAETLQQKETHLAKLDEHVSAFVSLIEEFESRLRGFPSFCNEISEGIRERHKQVTTIYAPESNKKDDESGPQSIFDLISGGGPQRLDIPLYRNNPYLTAFLHDLAEKIPNIDEDQKEEGKRLSRIPEVKYFIDSVKHNADKVVLTYIHHREHYEGAARAIEALHNAFKGSFLALRASGIREALRDSRVSVSAIYDRIVDGIKDRVPGQGSSLTRYEQFDPRDVIEYLGGLTSIKKGGEAAKEGPKKRTSKFEQAYLDLFAKLDEMVSLVAMNQAGNPEIEKFAGELLDLSEKTGNPRDRANSAELQHSIDTNNYAYTVVQQGHGELTLDRVPTGDQKFTDLVGDSWVKVENTLETLLDYSQFSGLYTTMTKRGRVNNNALIAGPAGCGKNYFLKVLQSDPRVITVNMSTDRVLSMWHGKSEGNIRDLYELTYEKRLRHDKPCAIGWDEIDALFGQRRAGGISVSSSDIAFRMQKILQSVLDGDTFYEGVSLLGFTNEPENIPATVFRRFANVVVIDPLTNSERQGLMQMYLDGVPLSDNFEFASWDEFLEMTPNAHGDVIGKVFDRVYRDYTADIKLELPDEALKINERATELKEEGEKVDQAMRRQIFQELAPGKVVTPDMFRNAYLAVLSDKDVQGAMKKQERFYESIEQKLNEAFED